MLSLLTCTVLIAGCVLSEQANETLFDLDKRIWKLMLQPDVGKGPKTQQSLQKLHSELVNIYGDLKNGTINNISLAVGRELIRKKGFKIFKAPISEELLKVTYRWSQAFLDQFVDLIRKCKQVFLKIDAFITSKGLKVLSR